MRNVIRMIKAAMDESSDDIIALFNRGIALMGGSVHLKREPLRFVSEKRVSADNIHEKRMRTVADNTMRT
jgi:hypothetical protein